MQKIINVHIGQIKIAKDGEQLKAILGSCVGIGVIWQSQNICGLAHCYLPKSPVETFEVGAKFVDQAVRSLIALMKIQDEDVPRISVVVAGGGNMTRPDSNSNSLVGPSNFNQALLELKKKDFKIVHAEIGGNEGRKILIDSANYSFSVEKIPRIFDVA